jgi:hypothetical protein
MEKFTKSIKPDDYCEEQQVLKYMKYYLSNIIHALKTNEWISSGYEIENKNYKEIERFLKNILVSKPL